jgi:hypothetical protein
MKIPEKEEKGLTTVNTCYLCKQMNNSKKKICHTNDSWSKKEEEEQSQEEGKGDETFQPCTI